MRLSVNEYPDADNDVKAQKFKIDELNLLTCKNVT